MFLAQQVTGEEREKFYPLQLTLPSTGTLNQFDVDPVAFLQE